MAKIKTTYQQALASITALGGDFAITETTIGDATFRVFEKSSMSLHDLYQSSVNQFGDQPFLVYENLRWSYAETYQNTVRFAHVLLKEYQVQKGERVAIAMRNYPEWIISYMALTSIGAIAVPMNAWWTGVELKYGLEDSGAALVVADQERLERLFPLCSLLDLRCIAVRCSPSWSQKKRGLSIQHYEHLMMGVEAQKMPSLALAPDEDASIMYTSGSTGYPKGAVSSHRAILSSLISWVVDRMAKAIEQGMDLASMPKPKFPPATLITTPLFHVTGSHVLFLLSWFTGAKAVLMYKWEVQQAFRLIEQERITYFAGVPTMSWELLRNSNQKTHDLSSLMGISAGGAARPPEHVKLLQSQFPGTAMMGWGLTETNALGASNGGPAYLAKPASIGRPHPLVEIKILDEHHQEVASGQSGEIIMKSPSNVRGYWNQPEATHHAFHQGWFRTGDIGYVDEEGFLYIVDRAKDIVIRGGENISCLEVEAALYEHPAVLEATVFGIPDERLGEIVYSVLMIHETAKMDAEILKDFLKDRLAQFKIPEHYEFRTTPLPRGGTEKINKRQLRKEALTLIQNPLIPPTPIS